MKDLVSVIITTYGRTTTLRRAIESVLTQTYDNIEILIIDDNKDLLLKEQVRNIVNSYDDKRIFFISNKTNLGGALARNVGIKQAKGKYISFLDDDDEYFPSRIEKQINVFKNNDLNLALVYSYCQSVDSNTGKTKDYCYDYIGNCIYEGMYDCIAATSQWMCRKEALDSVGNFSDVPCKQDSTVLIKLLVNGYTIDRVPEILSLYHNDGDMRISSQGHKKRIEGEEKLRDLCRNYYYLIDNKKIKDIEYSFSCRIMEHYIATKQYNLAFECLKQIIFLHPFKRKSFSCYKSIIKNII